MVWKTAQTLSESPGKVFRGKTETPGSSRSGECARSGSPQESVLHLRVRFSLRLPLPANLILFETFWPGSQVSFWQIGRICNVKSIDLANIFDNETFPLDLYHFFLGWHLPWKKNMKVTSRSSKLQVVFFHRARRCSAAEAYCRCRPAWTQ